MKDLRNVHVVEVEVRKDGKASNLWVNVDGECALRVQMAEFVIIRTEEEQSDRDKRKSTHLVIHERTMGDGENLQSGKT